MILRDTVVQVDLTAIEFNMKAIREMVGPRVAIMPVVKANAYGHGAIEVAPVLMEQGAAYLAVATLTEALALRTAHKSYPIFILGHTPDRLLSHIVQHDITQTVFSAKQGELLNHEARKAGKKAKVHLKVDTGFHRLGTDSIEILQEICQKENLEVEGIFSHLALVNDEENKKQYDRFAEIISILEKDGASFKYMHIADSISAVDFPEYRMNMIRPGALIYGLKGFHKGTLEVKQSLTFVTKISQVRKVSAGEGVGYDYLWRASKDTVIGTLPFGYADGYPRMLRDKGYVTIRSTKCPIIGVICMDQCMVDLSQVPEVKEGETAIIYGDGSANTMSIAEVASLVGTNKNEIVASIAARPPRVYL